VVQVEVGERHRIGGGKGYPENRKLLERPQAGVDKKRASAMANHVTGGPPAGMGYNGPGAKNDAFHIGRSRLSQWRHGQNRRTTRALTVR